MTLKELLKLASRELVTYRTRTRMAIITVGTLFGLLLGTLFIMQGLENAALRYAESSDSINMMEQREDDQVVSSRTRVKRFFDEKNKKFVRPASVALMVVAVFVLVFTMAHILVNDTSIILYRSLGASKKQILLIYFVYLLELSVGAVFFALILAIVLSGVATIVGGEYLLERLAAAFPGVPRFWPVLFGVNLGCAEVVFWMFLMVPVSFLLCLDQFSSKKMIQKLKGGN